MSESVEELPLGVFGIVFSQYVDIPDEQDPLVTIKKIMTEEMPVSASIESDLHEEGESEWYGAAMDAIESLLLAHYCAGVDVLDPGYIMGIETAVQAIAANAE